MRYNLLVALALTGRSIEAAPFGVVGALSYATTWQNSLMDDPLQQAKAKAAATYDAAADHFDDEPLGFWKRVGDNAP